MSAWRVARSRNFGPYLLGNASSASGTWFHNLAASVLVYRLTHSPFLLGVLNFSQFLPVLVFAPLAGRVADRYDRRRILLTTQPAAALVSAALAATVWLGQADEWSIIAFSFGLGTLNAFTTATQMALVASLVPREDLAQATALNSVTFNLARAIGPVSAAAVVGAFGAAPAFAVNTASFLVMTAALLVVRPEPAARRGRTTLLDGLRALRANPKLLGYLAVVVTVSFVTDPINTESPAFADEFGLGSAWAGVIIGAFGLGAVIAGATFAGRLRPGRWMAATLVLMGGGILGLAVAPWFPLALVFAFAAGFGYLSSNAAATTKLQLEVDDALRGRVMALWSVAFLGVRPIASMLDGAVSDLGGVRVAAAAMAVPAFGVAALIVRARSVQASGPVLSP